MYQRCEHCWALTSSASLGSSGGNCGNCGRAVSKTGPVVDVAALAKPRPAGAPENRQGLTSAAYDPAGPHHGCWYEVKDTATIVPTPVAVVQFKGPGDALRFLHAATCLLEDLSLKATVKTRMIVFIEAKYVQHIVGLYSRPDRSKLSNPVDPQNPDYLVYPEDMGAGRTIDWVVPRDKHAGSSMGFSKLLDAVLAYLSRRNYRWYSPAGMTQVLLEPFQDETRKTRYPGVQFARIDLNISFMEGGRWLRIPHTPRGMRTRPHNTVRVLLYLRDQGQERNTPWFHLSVLRSCQERLASRDAPRPVRVEVTLAGMKEEIDYRDALARIAPANLKATISHQVLVDWGWRTYCYRSESFQTQLAKLDGKFDVAVGINTSALDLAAAAGCVVLRDREWWPGEYTGKCFNLFLLAEATYGIFSRDDGVREELFKHCLEHILHKIDSLAPQYVKVEKGDGQRLPRELVIGSLS